MFEEFEPQSPATSGAARVERVVEKPTPTVSASGRPLPPQLDPKQNSGGRYLPPLSPAKRVGAVVLGVLMFAPLIAVVYIIGTQGISGRWEGQSTVKVSTVATQDKDDDGLSEAEENTYQTNPALWDTDTDGYSDGEEVAGGYNPKLPAPTVARSGWSVIRPTSSGVNGYAITLALPQAWKTTVTSAGDGVVIQDEQGAVQLSVYLKQAVGDSVSKRVQQSIRARLGSQKPAPEYTASPVILMSGIAGYRVNASDGSLLMYQMIDQSKQIDIFYERKVENNTSEARTLSRIVQSLQIQ